MTEKATIARIRGANSKETIPIYGDVNWRLTTGVQPFLSSVSIARSDVTKALNLSKSRNNVILEVDAVAGNPKIEYFGLNVLYDQPAADPNEARIVLADRRYWWSYKHHYQWVNWRRRTGTRRRGDWQERSQQDATPTFQYARFSLPTLDLFGGAAWEPLQLLIYVINEVEGFTAPLLGATANQGGALGIVRFDEREFADIKAMPIEHLDLDMPGDQAIARALSSVPGAGVTVRPDGRVALFAWTSGAERSALLGDNDSGTGLPIWSGDAGPEIVGGGHVELTDRANIRPSKIRVLFTPEVEVRFDIRDGFPKETSVSPTDAVPRELENVLPLPDFSLLIGGQRVYQGTYVTRDAVLAAWEPLAGIDGDGSYGKLTLDRILKAFIPERGLWAQLNLLGMLSPSAAEALWTARIAAIQRHFRQTYQLPRDWIDRTFDIRPYLVGTIDWLAGQRAPALAWTEHFIHAADKVRGRREDGRDYYGWNSEEPPMDASGNPLPLDDTYKPAPATISVPDADQGIVRINYQLDPYGRGDIVLPSHFLNVPRRRFRWKNREPIFNNAISRANRGEGRVPQLKPTFRGSILLTLVPATSLYAVEVKPDQVNGVVPKAVREGLTNVFGPVMEVRVGPGMETARIQWRDADSDKIEQAFGMRIAPGSVPNNFTKLLRPLCVNDGPDTGASSAGAASLQRIAVAMAASIWSTMHDRVEGSAGFMGGDFQPVGAIDSVDTRVSPDGAVTSQIGLRQELPKIDPVAFMDRSTFRVVKRTVY